MKWTQTEAVQPPYQPLRNELFQRIWSACVLTEFNQCHRFFEKKKVPGPKYPGNGSFSPAEQTLMHGAANTGLNLIGFVRPTPYAYGGYKVLPRW